jgi:DNA-binding transcriptional LysR family regulator
MSNNSRIRNLSGMLIFCRVVEAGSFTAAARQLGLSKASVSREISTLEDRLGAQLLRRTTRSMSLTEVGDIFYGRCQRVAEEAEAAELSVSQLRAEPRGVIRVAAPMSFGHLEIAPRLPGFIERYPDLRVEFELTDRVIDLVHERIDLAIRIGRPRNQSHVFRRLCPIRALLAASHEYLERAGIPQTPAELADHNCLGYRGPCNSWPFAKGERVETSGNLSADNGDALRRAALEGLGLIYLPTYLIADDVRAGRLIPVLSAQTSPESALFAVYPESRHLSPKVRALIDWLAEEFGPDPDWETGLPVVSRRHRVIHAEPRMQGEAQELDPRLS